MNIIQAGDICRKCQTVVPDEEIGECCYCGELVRTSFSALDAAFRSERLQRQELETALERSQDRAEILSKNMLELKRRTDAFSDKTVAQVLKEKEERIAGLKRLVHVLMEECWPSKAT